MIDFEKSFSDFIDRREYDQAAYALFSIVRIAYKAGWIAAGGDINKMVLSIHEITSNGEHSDGGDQAT